MSRIRPDGLTSDQGVRVALLVVQRVGGSWGVGIVTARRAAPRSIAELDTGQARKLAVQLLLLAEQADHRNRPPSLFG